MATTRKQRTIVNTAAVVLGTFEVNGRVIRRGLDWKRVEYSDGTVEETGLPPGWPEGLSVGEIMTRYFTGTLGNDDAAEARTR